MVIHGRNFGIETRAVFTLVKTADGDLLQFFFRGRSVAMLCEKMLFNLKIVTIQVRRGKNNCTF